MAKAKKQKALVPESEQPYEVPGNWVWVKFLSAFDIEYGKGLPTKELTESGHPVFGANGQIGFYVDYMFEEEQVLMSCRGANSGVINLSLPFSYITNNSLIIQCKAPEVSSRFIKYLLKSQDVSGLISGSAQPQVTIQAFDKFIVPLPPLAEQHRIVVRIESLFAKLDRAKELAQSALDSFETRKAAILHKAFTGELTAKWREENGVGLDNWETESLVNLCDSFQYGTSKKSTDTGSTVVLRMGNLQNGEIDWNELVFTSDVEDIEKYSLKMGDVLFNRTNSAEKVGKTSIYRGERPAIFAGYLIRIKYRNCLNGFFLNYMLNTPQAKEYCHSVKSDAVNQSNINAKKIAAFKMPCPSLPEQQEIVRILNRLLEKEQRACELCDVIEKIDLMKKAILARAFRGELGTNDPNEESALGLLSESI